MQTNSQQYDYAIIGAGTAGCYLAGQLLSAGYSCLVIEKSRGLGGRCARRRLGEFSADMGATAVSDDQLNDATRAIFQAAETQGLSQIWNAQCASFTEQEASPKSFWTAQPSMNSLHRHWLGAADLLTETRIAQLAKTPQGWSLLDTTGARHVARRVISTIPARQGIHLFNWPRAWQPAIHQQAKDTLAQFAVIIETSAQLPAHYYEGGHPVLARAVRDSSKPKRTSQNIWVLHSTPEWTQQHLGDDIAIVGQQITDIFDSHFNLSEPSRVLHSHRWLLSRTHALLDSPAYFWDEDLGLGIAADWLGAGTLPAALNSAQQLMHALTLNGDRS